VDEAERKRIAAALEAVRSTLTQGTYLFRSTGSDIDTQESGVELIQKIAAAAGVEIDVTTEGTLTSRLTLRRE
jgi:hypothetical protein